MLYKITISTGAIIDTLYVEAKSIPAACKKVQPKLEDYKDYTDGARIASVVEVALDVIR